MMSNKPIWYTEAEWQYLTNVQCLTSQKITSNQPKAECDHMVFCFAKWTGYECFKQSWVFLWMYIFFQNKEMDWNTYLLSGYVKTLHRTLSSRFSTTSHFTRLVLIKINWQEYKEQDNQRLKLTLEAQNYLLHQHWLCFPLQHQLVQTDC